MARRFAAPDHISFFNAGAVYLERYITLRAALPLRRGIINAARRLNKKKQADMSLRDAFVRQVGRVLYSTLHPPE